MDEETQFSNSITLARAYVELSSTLFFYLFMSRENEIIIYSIKKGGGRVVLPPVPNVRASRQKNAF